MYERAFVVANEGNLSIRIGPDEILCTPSMHSKGYLTEPSLVTVNGNGEPIDGENRPSSEVLLHLEVYRRRPDVTCVVHCHPPHATAFAIAREAIPVGVTPEAELFLGEVPIAPYATPGTPALAESIAPFVMHTNVLLLANHGTLSYDAVPEHAFWWTEILEKYCQTLLMARSLGGPASLTDAQMREVIAQKVGVWGKPDPRGGEAYASEDLRTYPLFRATWPSAGVGARVFDRASRQPPPTRSDDAATE